MSSDPRQAVDALAASTSPFLIGVRHHSPALSAVMEHLLEDARPTRLLVELPAELADWIEWLGHPELVTPVAAAVVNRDGTNLGFYPFADFSPELVAIRWACRNGIPVVPCDLPAARRAPTDDPESADTVDTADDHDASRSRVRALDNAFALHATDSFDELWDRMVEAPAPGAAAEAIRRSALALGWALRHDAEVAPAGVDRFDLERERWMRRTIVEAIEAGDRVVCIVGAFHAPALVGSEATPTAERMPPVHDDAVVSSLVPYRFELLDSRSGYPAGIRDPEWQQAVWESRGDPRAVEMAAGITLTAVTAGLRGQGHAAGTPDAREALRVALDLAGIRDLPAPGRRELVEALQSTLSHGEPMGRGRAVARAMGDVLVGHRVGTLASGTPRSGLAPHVEDTLRRLRLPGPSDGREPADLRLDPLRSDLDRRREIALQRLAACSIPYGTPGSTQGRGGAETVTRTWRVQWQVTTAAVIELCGLNGVTLEQVAEGALRTRSSAESDTAHTVTVLAAAAACDLPVLAREMLAQLGDEFPRTAPLVDVMSAWSLVDRLTEGPQVGWSPDDDETAWVRTHLVPQLLLAALREVEGVAGSDRDDDAAALHAVITRLRNGDEAMTGIGRLRHALRHMADHGSPLMEGAAGTARLLIDDLTPDELGERLASWFDGSDHGVLAARLRGLVLTSGPLLETMPGLLGPLVERLGALDEDRFLPIVPAVREGFAVLSTAARRRLAAAIADHLDRSGPRGADLDFDHDPGLLALWARADRAAAAAVGLQAAGLQAAELTPPNDRATDAPRDASQVVDPDVTLARWYLVLGQRKGEDVRYRAAGLALDRLYGHGHGEGSGTGDGIGDLGGTEDAFPTAREWADAIEDLFGTSVREELLARAGAAGDAGAAFELDPDKVTPSVELLQQMLSLKGGLGEDRLPQLRRLVRRVVDELVRSLAVQLRPALVGGVLPRTTRRPGGPIDLRRTIDANLDRLQRGEDGVVTVVPENLRYRVRARRSLDWRIVLVVDVSGSMEPSTIYAALMSAIFAGLPAVDSHFVAFSTHVVDLSEHADDPLSLLLEVSVGGGTNIAAGLRYARSLITVPSRTIVVLVSDFEEGAPVGSLLSEVRELAGSGAHLLGIAALDDRGAPRFSKAIAEQVVDAGMPVAALSPSELAAWVGERLR